MAERCLPKNWKSKRSSIDASFSCRPCDDRPILNFSNGVFYEFQFKFTECLCYPLSLNLRQPLFSPLSRSSDYITRRKRRSQTNIDEPFRCSEIVTGDCSVEVYEEACYCFPRFSSYMRVSVAYRKRSAIPTPTERMPINRKTVTRVGRPLAFQAHNSAVTPTRISQSHLGINSSRSAIFVVLSQ